MAGHAQLKFVMTECSKTQIPVCPENTAKSIFVPCSVYTLASVPTCFCVEPSHYTYKSPSESP